MGESSIKNRPYGMMGMLAIAAFVLGAIVVNYMHSDSRLQNGDGITLSNGYSDDSKLLYYYLLYTEGILSNDMPMVKEGLQGLVGTDPSETLFTEAILYFFSQQEFEEAVVFAEKAIKLFPNNENMIVFLAEGYSQTDKLDKAVELLEKSRSRGIESDFITEELIGLYLRSNQTDKANALLSAIPETKSTPATIFFQSKLYIQQGKFTKARHLLRLFTERFPDVADAWVELGAIEEKLGNIPGSINAYKHACQLAPDNEEIWLHLAELQISTQNVAAAFNTLQQHPNLAEYGFNGAILLSNNGYHSEAKVLIADAIAQGADPNEGAVLMATIVLRTSDNFEEALQQLDNVKSDSQFYSLATERKAQLLAHMDRCGEAQQLIRQLHEDNVSTIEIWGIEAYCHAKNEKFENALNVLDKALQEFPDNTDLLFSQASIYNSSDNKDKAFTVMEKILSITPDDARALNYIGYTLAEQGKDLDRALQLILRAHETEPDAEYILDSLAWVYYQRGEYDQAWHYINQCLGLADEDPIIWEHYGDIASKRKDMPNAVKGYENALQQDPKNRREIEKKLKDITPNHKKLF